jgi:rare lipoprotein A
MPRSPQRVYCLAALALWLLLFAAGCSAHRFERNRPGAVQRGVASWYGADFHGRRTASGSIYDMHDMTAAHRELPLGSQVEVRNLENGRSVRVEITDRGPFKKGRIVDMSYAAAKDLGMLQKGTAKVELQILELGRGPSGPKTATRFTVQVGAFRDPRNAESLQQELAARRSDVELKSDGKWHRVRVGLFRSLDDAEALRGELLGLGYHAVVVYLN